MKKLILLPILVVALLFGVIVFGNNKTYAATGQVVDRSTIKIGDQVFFDSDINRDFNYQELNPTDGCPDEIKGFDNDDLSGTKTPAKATLFISTAAAGSSTCNTREETIAFGSSRANFIKAFVWADENTIAGSDGKLTFIRKDSSSTFVSDNDEYGCRDTVTIASNNQAISLQERTGGANKSSPPPGPDHNYDYYPFDTGSNYDRTYNDTTGCWEAPVVKNIQISGTPESGNDGGAPNTGGSSGAAKGSDSCESTGGVMSWIMCPVVFMVDKAFSFLSTQIEELLEVKDYRDPGLHQSWVMLRNLSYLLLVPIMLVMVIGTALGFEIVSAYTVKKALPRMVVAVIFIALSWEITGFLIQLISTIGVGIRGLLLSPFDINSFRDVFTPTHLESTGQHALTIGAVGLVIFSSTALGIVLSFLGSAALVMLTVFLFLIARQMFILALMLVAPLAIIAWIFPGNDKLWKSWWGLFSKLLYIYPIIMGMTAIGLIFAKLVGGSSMDNIGDSGVAVGLTNKFLFPLMKVAAFVIPYALIPLAFKFVGGVVGNLAGMVNDRSKGLSDRLKQQRAGQYSRGWKEIKAGTLTNRGGKFGAAFGTGLSGVASGPRGWIGGKGRRSAFRQTALTQAGAEFMEADQIVQANKNDDKFLLALANRQMAERKRNAATGMEREVWNQALEKASLVKNQSRATKMAAAQAWAASGYNFETGQAGYNELAETIATASGAQLMKDEQGNAVGATGPNAGTYGNAMNNAQYLLKNAGRFDLGGINYGAGYNYKAGIDRAGGYQAGQAKTETHIAGAEALLGSEFVQNGKTLESQEFKQTLRQRVESGNINLEDLGTHHRNLLDAFNGATGANKTEIGKQLDAIEAVTSNTQATPGDERTLNNILAAQAVVNKNKQDSYRGQPQGRAVLEEQNRPPEL